MSKIDGKFAATPIIQTLLPKVEAIGNMDISLEDKLQKVERMVTSRLVEERNRNPITPTKDSLPHTYIIYVSKMITRQHSFSDVITFLKSQITEKKSLEELNEENGRG